MPIEDNYNIKCPDDATVSEIVNEFIGWAESNSPDAWWIYDDTDSAIRKFILYRNSHSKQKT